MNEEIQIILETTEKVLQKNINHQLRQNIDQKNDDLINLWNEVEEIGLPKIVVKEKFDGFNLEFASVLPIIQVWNDNLSGDSLKYVYVISNFEVEKKSLILDLPFNGKWKNLLSNEFIEFSQDSTINLEPGTSLVLGNYLDCGPTDSDSDGIGDVCDDDRDGDGILNSVDTCLKKQ